MSAKAHCVCPWWLGYFLVSPVRKLFENPERLLGRWIRPGMRVLDFGPGMGFYSLPAARLAGENGHVTCVDVQPKMLAALRRRAERAGLGSRIDTVVSPPDDLGPISPPYDLVLAIHVLHETPDAGAALRRLAGVLKSGGHLLLLEPRGHVGPKAFEDELVEAGRAGLERKETVRVRHGWGALLAKEA